MFLSRLLSYFHVIMIDLSKTGLYSVWICPNRSVQIYCNQTEQSAEVSFFRFRCEESPNLDVKSSVADTNILVTSICDSPSHMCSVLMVTRPDYFFYYLQTFQIPNLLWGSLLIVPLCYTWRFSHVLHPHIPKRNST